MSLKQDYYDGLTGLHQKLREAFQAGIDFIGSGTQQECSLDFGNIDGAALDLSGAVPGLYWDVSAPSLDYRIWYRVDTEIAPVAGGRNLLMVTVLNSDTRAQVATKTMNALNQLSNTPFQVSLVGDSLDILASAAGTATSISNGTLGGTSVALIVTPGVAASGNYQSLQNSLKSAAAQGTTKFTVTLPTSFNAGYLRQNNGDNLLRKAYFAGIQQGLADAEIYNYECVVVLNVKDSVSTQIDLNFNFQTT